MKTMMITWESKIQLNFCKNMLKKKRMMTIQLNFTRIQGTTMAFFMIHHLILIKIDNSWFLKW